MTPRPDLPLPAPAVPPDLYDEDYYRSTRGGHEALSTSAGATSDGMYVGFLRKAGFRECEVLVDLGCGRGELLAAAVAAGAQRAVGVECSPRAVRLAAQTLEARRAGGRGEVVQGDLRAVPLPDGSADLVTMLDVVEHLAPPELDAALTETRPAASARRPAARAHHAEPRDLLADVSGPAHRPGTTRRLAGLRDVRVEVGEWVYNDFVPSPRARRVHDVMSRVPGLRRVAVGNLWGEARR